MKNTTSTKKIPGGKMLRIDAGCTDQVEWVNVTGDFFLHPEETLEQIENCLVGARIPLDQPALVQCIASVLADSHAELIGATPTDIVAVLQEAVG